MGKRRRRADDDLGAPSAVAQSRAPPPRVPEAPTAAEYARRPADARAPATNPSSRTLAPESDPADDCETPLEAYRHVAPALAKLAQRLKIPKSELRVWDPYYCEGAVARHLSSLGFPNVRNDPVDFYRVVDGDAEPPPHDVLVTNPPFSGDHARRLFTYLAARPPTLPFAVLAPEYVHRKVWYAPVLRTAPDVFYVVPRRRYRYVAARGGRMKNAARTPCRHWVRDGRCPREDACPFAHGDGDGDGDGKGGKDGDGDGNHDVPGDDRSEVVAPFDTMWHVHCGKGRNASVVAALRQKRFGGDDGDDSGAALVTSTGNLAPPPTKRRGER